MSSSLQSAAVADGAASAVLVSYSLQARAEPGVLPRVVELFAKRGLVPQKWHSTASGPTLTIEVQFGGLDRDVADYIARCMRQIVGVEIVLSTATPLPG